MLIVFHTKPAAEVLMFSQHALPILRAAGKDFTEVPERGVIERKDLTEAIAGIERAISLDRQREPGYTETDDDSDTREHPISQPVTLRQRAFPLLAMLRIAREHDADVTWEPAPVW